MPAGESFIEPSEVFISDGAKSDCGNIGDMLRHDNSIGVTDPVYPVYIDSNVMSGRTGVLENGKWSDVVYIPCTEENNFVPDLPSRRVDILYLCYPNNPTGTTLTKDEIEEMGKLCPCQRRAYHVRLRLRGLYTGPEYPPLYLRDQRSEEGSHRIPELL